MYKRTPLEKRLFLRGRVWAFQAYDYTGKRYTASTHQTDYKAALGAARKIERDRSVPPTDPATQKTQGFTLGQAMKLLAAHDKRVNAKPNTVRFHEDRGRHLLRVFGAEMLCSALAEPSEGLAALTAYSDRRLAEVDFPADRHTIQKEHRVLRHALRLGKDLGFYAGNPSKLKVEGFIKSRGASGFYQPGETWLEKVEWIEALVAQTSANPDKHRIDRRDDILVYVNLGLRRREPHLIKHEHVDLKNKTLTIRMPRKEAAGGGDGSQASRKASRKTGLKTDKSKRVLPLNELMVELFKRRLRSVPASQPLFTEWGKGNRDLQANWRRARAWLLEREARNGGKDARAELDAVLPRGLTFNCLRRTFCSQMKNAGVSLEDCAELLGHEDIAMVRLVYGHTAMDTLRRAVAKLPDMTLPAMKLPRTKGPSRRQRQRLARKGRAEEQVVNSASTDAVCDANQVRETGVDNVG